MNFIHLLANPYYIKRDKEEQKNNITNEIFCLIKKRFPKYNVNETYKGEILNKLEKILYETTIKSTIDDIIEKIEWNQSSKNTYNKMLLIQ